MNLIIIGLLFLVVGFSLGYIIRQVINRKRLASAEHQLDKIVNEAKERAKEITFEAQNKALEIKNEAIQENKKGQELLKKIEDKFVKQSEQLEQKVNLYDKKEENLKEEIKKVAEIKVKIENARVEELKKLESIASLTKEEAKKKIFEQTEIEEKDNLAKRLIKLQNESHTEIERKAKETLLFVMQRMASAQSAETSTTTIQVASEEIKGKIIGKEGRNIRSFEKATGVTLIVDDTPGAITLSCFDSVRRNVAKVALEKLIADGRIQPARIEELVLKAEEEIEKEIQKKGEEAVFEVGVPGVDPKLIHLLGRLHYRTSFGQSVLKHSLEMAHLAGMLAAEVSADVQISRVGALFHDIGKAVDHEVVGTHVEIGRKILRKFNMDERIVLAMQSHHEEYPFETLESVIVQVVDALSGGRPGARRGTIENYIKRLEDLEKIANSFDAVEKSYAISAGREVRVFVKPELVSDTEAIILAKKIATEIEKEMKYPGEIKVNVIRETRAIEYAK
ncbi:ribonuclease Y [Candidatus Azambacteria bacterium]|nr:ribonuclease Y [Candidatus Azambacteria bacterium]